MKSFFNCAEWKIKDFYKITVEKSFAVAFQMSGLTGYLHLRSQKSNVNDAIPTSMFLKMQINKQMVSTPWNFHGSFVKFEACVKDFEGKLDYHFEEASPGSLLKYPAVNSEYIYDEEIQFDYVLLKDKEVNHSKDGSLTFAVFLTIHEKMFSPQADVNVYPHLYETNIFSDFKIICNKRNFPVHRAVLCEISPVFMQMLQAEMIESKTCEVVIKDIDENVMEEMIRFVYTGKANFDGDLAVKLLRVAEKYGIEKLKEKCIEFLNWDLSVDDAIETLVLANQFEAEYLLKNCIQFIKVRFDELKEDRDWENVNGKVVMELAKDLNKEPFSPIKLSS